MKNIGSFGEFVELILKEKENEIKTTQYKKQLKEYIEKKRSEKELNKRKLSNVKGDLAKKALEFLDKRLEAQLKAYENDTQDFVLFKKILEESNILQQNYPDKFSDSSEINKDEFFGGLFLYIPKIFSKRESELFEKILEKFLVWGKEFNQRASPQSMVEKSGGTKELGEVARKTDSLSLDGVDRMYRYSTTSLTSRRTTAVEDCLMKIFLDRIDRAVKEKSKMKYNSNYVYLNRYAGGDDSLGAHSDGEGGMDPMQPIISLTFGVARNFKIVKKLQKKGGLNYKTFVLGNGDLLLMLPGSQELYTHEVPKQPKVQGIRYNLTFRMFKSFLKNNNNNNNNNNNENKKRNVEKEEEKYVVKHVKISTDDNYPNLFDVLENSEDNDELIFEDDEKKEDDGNNDNNTISRRPKSNAKTQMNLFPKREEYEQDEEENKNDGWSGNVGGNRSYLTKSKKQILDSESITESLNQHKMKKRIISLIKSELKGRSSSMSIAELTKIYSYIKNI